MSRVERKERTRRAILDAALDLSDETTLAAISLRQVAGALTSARCTSHGGKAGR